MQAETDKTPSERVGLGPPGRAAVEHVFGHFDGVAVDPDRAGLFAGFLEVHLARKWHIQKYLLVIFVVHQGPSDLTVLARSVFAQPHHRAVHLAVDEAAATPATRSQRMIDE